MVWRRKRSHAQLRGGGGGDDDASVCGKEDGLCTPVVVHKDSGGSPHSPLAPPSDPSSLYLLATREQPSEGASSWVADSYVTTAGAGGSTSAQAGSRTSPRTPLNPTSLAPRCGWRECCAQWAGQAARFAESRWPLCPSHR